MKILHPLLNYTFYLQLAAPLRRNSRLATAGLPTSTHMRIFSTHVIWTIRNPRVVSKIRKQSFKKYA